MCSFRKKENICIKNNSGNKTNDMKRKTQLNIKKFS